MVVAAILITPVVLRYYEHNQRKEKAEESTTTTTAQTTTSATTTTKTTSNTTTTKSATITNEPIVVKSPKRLTGTTPTTETTSKTTRVLVGEISETTEIPETQIAETQEYTTIQSTTLNLPKPEITSTTPPPTTTTSAKNAQVEIEGYYPTEEEWNMFCVVVCSETGYCEDKAQLAVAHTVINRLSHPIYPNTIKEILTQRAQYTCVQNYYTGNMRPGLEIGGAAYNHTMQLVHQAWEEWDFTNGAVAYYNPHMIGWNVWFEQYECVYEDAYGRFFRV